MKIFGASSDPGLRRLVTTYYPADQTSEPFQARAQIQLIVRKVVVA